MQKYISKPDRKKLAEKLALKDSQVGMAAPDSLDCRPDSSNSPDFLDALTSSGNSDQINQKVV